MDASRPIDNGCAKENEAVSYSTVDDMLVRYNPIPNDICVWTPKTSDVTWEQSADWFENGCINGTKTCTGQNAAGRLLPPPAETIHDHSHCMYNEIIVDATLVQDGIKNNIIAFFYMKNCFSSPRTKLLQYPISREQTLPLYNEFVKDYGADNVILVAYDCERLQRGLPPFDDAI